MRSTINPRLRKSSWYSEWQFTLYDLLPSGRFGVRTPVGVTDFLFSSSIQSGPVAHIAFCTVCRGTFLGKSNRRVALATLRDLASRLRTSRVMRLLPTCAFMSCCGETLTFFLRMKLLCGYFRCGNTWHSTFKIRRLRLSTGMFNPLKA
jgi:hypothetical protein